MFKNIAKEQLKVPAHVDYLAELRDFVMRIGRKHGITDKSINAFKLAIDEAGTNIMRHAYRGYDEPGFVLLRVIVRKMSITVSLIDQGKYFDPREVKDPDLKRYVDIGKKGGLGIFIIRKLMDEIDYRKTEEGNELRMTKNRDTGKRQAAKLNTIPLSLKAKYFLRTASILTLIITCGYVYLYIRADKEIRQADLRQHFLVGEKIARQLSYHSDLNNKDRLNFKVLDMYTTLDQSAIFELILVHGKSGIIWAHSEENVAKSKWLQPFEALPNDATEVYANIDEYTIYQEDGDGKRTPLEVYDYHQDLRSPANDSVWGQLHIRIYKSMTDEKVNEVRYEELKLTAVILLLSYVGIILLIYILLNPFRKLSEWINAMDHGDEVEDEMDIDSSTEIGEIAKAFSDITTKFRESQRNLVEQEQLQKEMQVAQEIQQTLLPSEFPDLAGYELAAMYEAAKEVGGDYYDFVEVDKDTLGIVVADVSGKGVPGSLVMTMIRTALRTEARQVYDAAEVLAKVNDFVVGDMKRGMFVTVFYVIIDAKRRRLNYASAGHNPMILYRPSKQQTYYLNPKGFPIGIQLAESDLFRKSIESDTIQLAEEDILLLYTDGITEAMNSRRDLFGEERFLKCIREFGHFRVNPFVEKLQLEIQSFTEGGIQYDDITLVSIKEKTSPEKEELRRAKLAHRHILDGMNIRESCEKSGITTYAYYNKYKKQFEEHGTEGYEIDSDIAVEAKHISIEDKTKIFDIIKNHPEYGAKRISEELLTEKYGNTRISESKVYDELVRGRLNTRQLREAFISRTERNHGRMKPPGTPMLTLDGRVIIDQNLQLLAPKEPPPPPEKKEEPASQKPPPVDIKKWEATPPQEADVDMDVLSTPIEELLDKSRDIDEKELMPDDVEAAAGTEEALIPEDEGDENNAAQEFSKISDDDSVSFNSFFDEASAQLKESDEEDIESSLESQDLLPEENAECVETDVELEDNDDEEESSHEENGLFAVEDLLEQEISNSFADGQSDVIIDEGHSHEVVVTDSDENLSLAKDTELAENEHSVDDSQEVSIPDENSTDDEKQNETSFYEIELAGTAETSEDVVNDDDTRDDSDLNGFHSAEDEQIIFLEQENGFHPSVDDSQLQIEPKPELSIQSQAVDVPDYSADDTEIPEADDSIYKAESELQSEVIELDEECYDEDEPKLEPLYDKEQQFEKEQLLIEGLKHYKREEYDLAITKFKTTVEIFPDFKEAHSILGNAYFRLRHFDAAFLAYDRVLQLDPNDTTAHENLGVIFANQSKFDKAVYQWRKIIAMDPARVDIEEKIKKATDLLSEKQLSVNSFR